MVDRNANLRQWRNRNENHRPPLAPLISDIRKRVCRDMMRTSETGPPAWLRRKYGRNRWPDAATATNRQPGDPALGALPSAHGQLPKTAAFWLMAVIFGSAAVFRKRADAALCGLFRRSGNFSLHDPDSHIRRLRPWRVLTALLRFRRAPPPDRIGRRPVPCGILDSR